MLKYLIVIVATSLLSVQAHADSIFNFDYESNARLPAIVFLITLALAILLIGLSYLINSLFMRLFRSSLTELQQVAVGRLTTRRERVNQIYQAIREGFLFLPEAFITVVVIVAFLTMLFLAFDFKIRIEAGSENYIYMFYACILAFAILFQLLLVVKRFRRSQISVNDQLLPLNLPESYLRRRRLYNILFNMFLFLLGLLLWLPLVIAIMWYPPELSPYFRVYFLMLIGIFLMCVILRGLRI